MPISSFDSTGRSGASRLPTRTCSVAATSRSTGPVMRRARKKESTKATSERGEADEDLRVLDLAEGRRAPARGCAGRRPRRRAGRRRSGSAGRRPRRSRRRPRAASGPIVLPWRSTAWTRSSRRSIAASAAAAERSHRGRGEGGLGRLAGLGRVGEEDDLRVQELLEVARDLVVDLEAGRDDAHQARAALEHGRRDDVVELSARKPDALGLLALERPGDRRHAGEVGRVGQRPVGPRERRRPRRPSR